MFFKKIILILFLLALSVFSQSKVYAQVKKGMLMYLIENKEFKKESFNRSRALINYQDIKVGNIIESNGLFSLEIKTKTFDKDDNLKKEETSRYICNIKDGNIFMGVIPFINKPSKKINIKVLSGNFLYPTNITELNSIDDYRLALSYNSGVFGISSKIYLNYINRSIIKVDKNTYIIIGKIEIKTIITGVNISNLNYKSEERIELSKGIVYQKFVKDSGDYFTIKVVNR